MKKGPSNFSERKRLFQMAFKRYDLRGFTLLADREYIGRDWLLWLDIQEINFVIRLPYKVYQGDIMLGCLSYEKLVNRARKGKYTATKVRMGNKVFRIVATKAIRDEHQLLLLLTNLTNKRARKICKLYRKRWKIESMFLHWKSNGLHIEDLNFKNQRKVRLVIALLISAYILCLTEGIASLKQIPKKKKGNLSLYYSIFAKGYQVMAKGLNDFVLFLECINQKFTKKKQRLKPT